MSLGSSPSRTSRRDARGRSSCHRRSSRSRSPKRFPCSSQARASNPEFLAEIRALQPDASVVVAYGHILTAAVHRGAGPRHLQCPRLAPPGSARRRADPGRHPPGAQRDRHIRDARRPGARCGSRDPADRDPDRVRRKRMASSPHGSRSWAPRRSSKPSRWSSWEPRARARRTMRAPPTRRSWSVARSRWTGRKPPMTWRD